MNSIAQTGYPPQGVQISLQSHRQQSSELTVEQRQGDQSRTVKVSASESSTVTLSAQYHNSRNTATADVTQADAVSDSSAGSSAADNILKFISLRVQQDAGEGASEDDIASRLLAGYEGFVKGFNEAYEQLSGAGLLSPEVEAAIEQTYTQVLAGIDTLAQEYGVASPVTASSDRDTADSDDAVAVEAPVTILRSNPEPLATPQQAFAAFALDAVNPAEQLSELLESSSLNYEQLAQRDFSFSLKTQDGDTVTITASANQQSRVQYGAVNYASDYGNYQAGRFSAESSSSSAFSLQVDGDLDEGELAAINDLLGQVGDLSETFFAGDLDQAFNMALELGFDESEISQFALNLKQEVYTKIESTYGAVSNIQTREEDEQSSPFASLQENNKLLQMSEFIKLLDEAQTSALKLGLPSDFVTQAVDSYTNENFADNPQKNQLVPLIERLSNPSS